MRVSLSKVLVLFAVCVSALPILTMAFLVGVMNADIMEIVGSEFDKISLKSTRLIVDDSLKICRIIQKTQADEDERARGLIRAQLAKLGAARVLPERIAAKAASQMTPTDAAAVKIPKLSFGETPLKIKISDDGRITGGAGAVQNIIDSIKRDTGLDVCFFVRIDEAGNMLRVANTALDDDGQPYVGTYIPAAGGYDDGAIVRTLLARKTFSGISRAGKFSFIVNYDPILDPYGDVIGAVSCGRPQSSIDFVLRYFEGIRIGSNGYVWAIELVGRGESVVRVSRDGRRNGLTVESDALKERRDVLLEIINSSVAQGDGKVSVREYKTSDGRREADIVTAYAYFKPWNMVFGVTAFKGDFGAGVSNVENSVNKSMLLMLPLGLGIFALAGAGAWLAAVRGAQMTGGLISAVKKIKSGDIASARSELFEMIDTRQWSNVEIYRLALAFNAMSANLATLVSKVQVSGVNLAESANTIAAGAAQINSVTRERTEALEEISGTINTISKSVVLLNADSREAARNVGASLKVMSDGGNLLARLNENAASLLSAAGSVAARLAVIKDKTERIAAAITTINAVSERTNMLSLNASIEAERAGELGEGFDGVSAEIARLADRTAVSAMHVSKTVADMENSVDLGVGDMDHFSARMKASSALVNRVQDTLISAEGQLAELGSRFESLARGISSQEENAVGIGELMRSLESLADETSAGADTLNDVTVTLEKISSDLVAKVSMFKLPE